MRTMFEDAHLLVVEKPPGRDSTDLPGPVLVVHRLDKLTSGLLVYAKTSGVARRLARQFEAHAVERAYACVAHGALETQTIRSRLVRNRGDGLRGSGTGDEGKDAVTHVRVQVRHADRTAAVVTLETGRTHQIRIHLAEAGHPILGEPVYIRDHRASGRAVLPSPRLMLHATTLGFVHPATKALLRFESPAPW